MDTQTIEDIDIFWKHIRHFAVPIVFLESFEDHRTPRWIPLDLSMGRKARICVETWALARC